MKLNISKPTEMTARVAAAMVLTLGLAACDQQQPAEKMGQNVDRATEQAGRKMDQAANTAQKQLDQTKATVSEKAAEAGKTMDDAAVTAKVKSALITEPDVKALAIDVNTQDGVVTLLGTVDSLAKRDKATQIASSVDGVKSVTNNLKIISGS